MGSSGRSTTRRELPPSANFLLWQLESDGRQTRTELIDATDLPASTVDTGLKRLVDEGFARRDVHLEDTRKRVFEAVDDTET
jgi:DNA-binding MarR family transcriptional regulator